eukprot:s5132_g3.t1
MVRVSRFGRALQVMRPFTEVAVIQCKGDFSKGRARRRVPLRRRLRILRASAVGPARRLCLRFLSRMRRRISDVAPVEELQALVHQKAGRRPTTWSLQRVARWKDSQPQSLPVLEVGCWRFVQDRALAKVLPELQLVRCTEV